MHVCVCVCVCVRMPACVCVCVFVCAHSSAELRVTPSLSPSPLLSTQQVLPLLLPSVNGLCARVPHLSIPQHLLLDHMEQTLYTSDTVQTAVNNDIT